MMKDLVLSIDIGGTNIKVGWVTQDGKVLNHLTFKTHDFSSAADFAKHLVDNEEVDEHLPNALGIGIGAPNGNSYSGTIDNAPNLPWKGLVPLKDIFERIFHLPTYVANDANAAAVGEKVFGKGKKYQHFVEITLGTGLGSGIIASNQLLLGNDSLAGELGHVRVVKDGRSCNCGRKGCLERYASATGIMETFHLYKENYPDSPLNQISNVTTKEIFDAYVYNDALANFIITETVDILGNALADFACFSNPEAYIFFGGIIRDDNDFLERVKAAMEENLLYIYQNKIDVIATGLPMNDAALLGAAASVFLK